MDLANKTFKNNKTGEIIKVIDSFENIAILENKKKIDVNLLINENEFTEQIDPNSFFNGQSSYDSLANKIKNIPTENMVEEDGTISINVGGGLPPVSNESAVIMTTEDEEKAILSKKYGVESDPTDSISKQNEAFSKILDEGDLPTQPQVKTGDNDPIQHIKVNRNTTQQTQKMEDPIITMFKNVKRSVEFNISIDINDKIPRLDFIEMMEDSYKTSIIEFISEEFTRKILNDPSVIKDLIKDKINKLVYGGELKIKRETLPKVDTTKIKMLHEGTESKYILIPGKKTKTGKLTFKYINNKGKVVDMIQETAIKKGYKPAVKKDLKK